MYPLGFHKSILSVRDVTFGVLYIVLALVFNHLVSLPDLNFTIKLFKPCFEMPYFDFGNNLAVRKSFQNAHIQSTKAENFYILRFVIGLLV